MSAAPATPADEARPRSCADWLGRLGRELAPFQRLAVETLVHGTGIAIYNLPVQWRKVDWNYGHGVAFVLSHQKLATFDFSQLTGLVIAAHENCVRVSIEAATVNRLRIAMHPRKREGSIAERHPTIEQAVEAYRARRSA